MSELAAKSVILQPAFVNQGLGGSRFQIRIAVMVGMIMLCCDKGALRIMFEQENKFYEENKESLREKYPEKEVVIVQDKITGVYDTLGEAYRESAKTMTPGKFTIKHIYEDPNRPIDQIL